MKKIYLDIETADHAVHEGVRVLAVDKVRAARIARTNGIPFTDGPEVAELLAFAATTRAGLVAADDLEAWRAQVIDFAATNEQTADALATMADPTPAPPATPSMP